MKKLDHSAFTLLEILLAAIIFIISIGGVFAALNAIRTPVASKETALTAAVFGKQVLEALRSQVNEQGAAYFDSCGFINGDGSCGDFALSAEGTGIHEISVATLAKYGLSWPSTALSNLNLIAGSPVLKYTVSCADGSAAPCTASPKPAHEVKLNICIDTAC